MCQGVVGLVGRVERVSGDQVAGALTLAVLGLALVTVGLLARHGRLQLALGGWTRDTASPSGWAAAHRVIGTWFAVAGGVALVCALALSVTPSGWTGAWLGVGLPLMLVIVVVGVVRGTNRVDRAGSGDL